MQVLPQCPPEDRELQGGVRQPQVGKGTTRIELEAGTTTPSSNRHSCARLYLLSVTTAPSRRQETFAADQDMN